MTSPYGPSGGNDPQQWGQQQPYGAGYGSGTPSGGFPAQGSYGQGNYGQPAAPGQGNQPYPGYAPQPGAAGGQGQPYPGYGQQPGQPYPGYGQQQFGGYGQPGGYSAPEPPKKRSRTLWIVLAVLVVLAAAVLVVGLSAGLFVRKVINNTDVQQGVQKILTEEYKLENVSDVTCPADKPVKVGTTFECTAKIDGDSKKVKITVKTEDGQYEVSQPD